MKISGNRVTQNYSGIQKKGGAEAYKGQSDVFSISKENDTSWMMKDMGNLKSFDGGAFDFDHLIFGAIGAGVGATGGAIGGAFFGGGWGSVAGGAIGAVVGASILPLFLRVYK